MLTPPAPGTQHSAPCNVFTLLLSRSPQPYPHPCCAHLALPLTLQQSRWCGAPLVPTRPAWSV